LTFVSRGDSTSHTSHTHTHTHLYIIKLLEEAFATKEENEGGDTTEHKNQTR